MDSRGNFYLAAELTALQKEAEEVGAGGARARGKLAELVPITDFELAELRGMNRAQRRAWYSDKRRSRPRFGGGSR